MGLASHRASRISHRSFVSTTNSTAQHIGLVSDQKRKDSIDQFKRGPKHQNLNPKSISSKQLPKVSKVSHWTFPIPVKRPAIDFFTILTRTLCLFISLISPLHVTAVVGPLFYTERRAMCPRAFLAFVTVSPCPASCRLHSVLRAL